MGCSGIFTRELVLIADVQKTLETCQVTTTTTTTTTTK